MKKLIILILAAGLFTACNNNKAKDGANSTTSEKDDSGSKDKNKATTDNKEGDNTRPADGNTTEPANNNTDKPADYTTSTKWPAAEVAGFISSCVYKAVAGEMNRALAERYCNCMQVKMEQLYPDVQDLAGLTEADMQTPSIQRMAKDCLK